MIALRAFTTTANGPAFLGDPGVDDGRVVVAAFGAAHGGSVGKVGKVRKVRKVGE